MAEVYPFIKFDLVEDPESFKNFLNSNFFKRLKKFEKRSLLLYYCFRLKLGPMANSCELNKTKILKLEIKSSKILIDCAEYFN